MPRLPPGTPLALEQPSGTFIPRARARTLSQWIRYAQAYPVKIAQPMLRDQALALEYQCSEQLKAREAELMADVANADARASDRWGWPQKIMAVIGGVTAGVAIGVLAIEVAKR
jgi:hypothetical protein